MKKIITHLNPDLDAVASVWLIKKFLPGWEEAVVEFAPANEQTAKKAGEVSSETLYVDVGLGDLDHHQTDRYLCAAKICWAFVKKKRVGQELSPLDQKAVGKIITIVTQVDNARDINWQEVKKDRYYSYLHVLVDNLRGLGKTDEAVIDFGLQALEALFLSLKQKIRAKEDLKEVFEFMTPWGKAIATESNNKQVLWLGEVAGNVLVVKKDPEKGGVRVYARWDTDVDLTKVYNQVKRLDPEADWFLHSSKQLLLNDSRVNPGMRPTKLSLKEIIKVLAK